MATTIATKNLVNIDREKRYLIAQLEDQKIAFKATLVQEILVFKRSQILSLPFYNQSLLGVINHQNQIVPLVCGKTIFLEKTQSVIQANLTAVRLNQSADNLTGVAIVVDKMVENLLGKELNLEKLFQLKDIPTQTWQPQG